MGEFFYKTKGVNAPRTLNKITRQGARIKACKRREKSLFFTVSEKESKRVEKSLGESVLEFQKNKKNSFFDLFSPKRIGIVLGLILCVFIMLFLSRFFIKIEVKGLNLVEQKKVESFLKNHGVIPCKLKQDVDLDEVGKHLKKEFPFSVVSLSFKGVTLVVRVKEELSPSYYFDQTKKQSLYASENAVVTRIVKIDGTQMVEVGKSVKAGDLLIKNEKSVGESVLEIRAVGEIYGRVWREYEVFIPEKSFSYKDTGVKKIFYGVEFFRAQKEQVSPFLYSRREVVVTPFEFLPIYHYKTTFYEQKAVEIINPNFLDQTEILKRLKSEAEIKLQKEDGEFIRSWHTTKEVDGGKIVKLIVEMEKRIDEYR